MGMNVSAVVVTWNRYERLKVAIESILKQDYKIYELIVVDNRSDDGTREYLDDVMRRCIFEGIQCKIVYREMSAIEALNHGYKLCKGDYVFTLDDDAYCDDGTVLGRLVAWMDRLDDVGILGANVLCEGHYVEDGMSPIYGVECHPGAAFLIRRTLLEMVGYMDESLKIYGNELDLACKSRLFGYEVMVCRYVYVRHPLNDASKDERFRLRLKNSLHVLRYFNGKYKVLMGGIYFMGHVHEMWICRRMDLLGWWMKMFLCEILKSFWYWDTVSVEFQYLYYMRRRNIIVNYINDVIKLYV